MGAMKEISGATVITMPTKDIWFDDSQAADYLSCSVGHFQGRVVCQPGFPRPRMVIASRRWKASELSDWLDGQIGEPEKKIGRPRKLRT